MPLPSARQLVDLYNQQGPITAEQAVGQQAPSARMITNQVQNPPQTQNPPQDNVNYVDLGNSVLNMLKQYQQQGQARLSGAQTESAQRGLADLPPDLAGLHLSPSQILGYKQGEANALAPTIAGARSQISEATQGINDVKDYLKTIQDNENKQRDDARAVIQNALTLGGADSLKDLNSEDLKTLEKKAGYPSGYLEGLTKTLKERELELKRQNAALTRGLTAGQINTTVNQIAGSFDNEPLVKEFNTINTGVNFLKSLGNTPTDDIARVYQFAKIMDPTSSVREGEYKTVQDYATTLLQRYGLNAKRVFTNSGFLTDEARTFLVNTLNKRLDASRSQYSALKSQYDQRINQVKQGNMNTITNYDTANFEENGTVMIGGRPVPVGSIITNSKGQKGKVNADGTITPL